MTTNIIFEKEVIVTEIRCIREVQTGDAIHQIQFGDYIKSTAEIVQKINQMSNVVRVGDDIPVQWFTLNVKNVKVIPYKVGSKWKLAMNENGSITMVELP